MNSRITLVLILAALALAACAAPVGPTAPADAPTQIPGAQGEPTPAPPAAEENNTTVETIFIAPELKDCTGVGPMRCMQVAAGPDGPWTLFYNQIEGFTFEEGFAYELKVRTEQVANPPADGSSLRYILIELVSKTPAAPAAPAAGDLAGTSWTLSAINGAAPIASERPAGIEFNDAGRIAGSSGCNRMMGGYTVDGATLTVGQLAGTMMACPEPLMQQEQTFLTILGAAASYAIADDTLTITSADGSTLSFTRA